MCYNPLRIKSNKTDFDSRFDKVFFEVPCGKCSECQNGKIMSWSLRNYYEFLNCKDSNGVVFNFTLTYNNENLPKQFGISTFQKSDIQKFLKLLRKWLVKDNVLPQESIRYFVTSEYGHLHGRPHYHILFYIYHPVSPILFYKYVCKYWNRGFVGYGKLGMEVLDYHALNYACKYITKDSSYKSVVESVKLKYKELTDDKDLVNFDDFFKDFRQFHLESKGFGKCMLKYVTDKQLFLGKVFNPFSTNISSTLPIPLYIMRKVFYDEVKQDDGSIRYELNIKGVIRKLGNLNNQIDSDCNKITSYRTYPNDENLLNELKYDSIDTFFDKWDTFLRNQGFSYRHVFIYKHVYRDRVLYNMSDNFHLDLSKYLTKYDDNILQPLNKFKSVEKNMDSVCNYEIIFSIFEKFLGQLSAFKRFDAYYREKKYVEDYNIKQSQLAIANSSNPIYKDLPNPKDFFTYLSN